MWGGGGGGAGGINPLPTVVTLAGHNEGLSIRHKDVRHR